MTRVFHGSVKGGQIQVSDPYIWKGLIKALEGKEITVSLQKRRKVRSLDQNAYFHGVILPLLAEAAGYEVDEMKDALKLHFLSVEPTEKGKLPRVRGTSELDTAEFSNFCDQCIRLGAELYQIAIPDPYFLGEQ